MGVPDMYGEFHVPELVPLLSRGKHRSPRKGACFMELASYLAGERWSDHPECTHPLLAAVARLVNDYTTDAGRPRLAGLIPSVIGVTSGDPHLDPRIALRCASTALPVVSAERQRVMAVSILAAEHVMAQLGDPTNDDLLKRSRQAMARAPHAAQWANGFARAVRTSPKQFSRRAAPRTVHYAVEGIAQACVADPDGMLHDLLATTINDCRAWILPGSAAQPEINPGTWTAACQITGVTRPLPALP
ncbi:MAG TPA: hypothetical protein VFZ32_18420 [Micromonosporaceae bacterium]